jgi:hypothetical protein
MVLSLESKYSTNPKQKKIEHDLVKLLENKQYKVYNELSQYYGLHIYNEEIVKKYFTDKNEIYISKKPEDVLDLLIKKIKINVREIIQCYYCETCSSIARDIHEYYPC